MLSAKRENLSFKNFPAFFVIFIVKFLYRKRCALKSWPSAGAILAGVAVTVTSGYER